MTDTDSQISSGTSVTAPHGQTWIVLRTWITDTDIQWASLISAAGQVRQRRVSDILAKWTVTA